MTRASVDFVLPHPGRVAAMELAASELFQELRRLSVPELQAMRPTPPYRRFVDALIVVRALMT